MGSDGTSHTITLGTANSTDTLANLAATINAAGYGITATYNATTSVADTANIVFTSASSGASVSQTSATLTGTGTGTDVVGMTGQPTAAGAKNVTTLATITGTSTAVGTLTIGTNTIAVASGETVATLAAAINAGNYGVTASLNSANTTLTLTSANSTAPSTLTDTATTQALTAVNTTSSPYYSVGISGTIADTTTGGGTAKLGMSADNNGSSGIATISYSDWSWSVAGLDRPVEPDRRAGDADRAQRGDHRRGGAGRLHRRADQHAELGKPGAQHAAAERGCGAKRGAGHRLCVGHLEHVQVRNSEPDRHLGPGAGQQRAAGSDQAAAVKRGPGDSFSPLG